MSFLLPCFAVDHMYLSFDEYLFSEEDTPVSEGKDLSPNSLYSPLLVSPSRISRDLFVVFAG